MSSFSLNGLFGNLIAFFCISLLIFSDCSIFGGINSLVVAFACIKPNPPFTKEEQSAIKVAAKGGPIQNALRLVGKLAPTGIVSGGGSVGLGYLAGGPIGAVGLPIVGGVARKGAEQLGLRNIEQLRNRLATGNAPIPQVSTRGLIGARELAAPIINPISGLLNEGQ